MRCDAFEPGQHPRLREVWFTRSRLNFLSQEVSFEGLQDHVLGRRMGTWLAALSWHHNLGVSTICTLRACQFCLRSLQLGFETEEFTVWSFQFISHYAQISLDPFILPQTLRCSPWFCWFGVWSLFSSCSFPESLARGFPYRTDTVLLCLTGVWCWAYGPAESERRSWVVGLCSPGHVELSHGPARKSSQFCRPGMVWNVLERLGTFSLSVFRIWVGWCEMS